MSNKISPHLDKDQNTLPPRLDTIPPEVRNLIYDFIYNDLSINIDRFGDIEINYPWPLTSVSHFLRKETLPILRSLPISVICESGRFPEELSRKLPYHICRSIKHLTLQGSAIEYDIRLGQFPSLETLSISGYMLARAETFHRMFSKIRELDRRKAFVIEQCARGILAELRELHEEQERPREGLERDYIVEGTLFDVITSPTRAFKVQVSAVFVWGVLDDLAKDIHFDWDSRCGDVTLSAC